MNIAESLVGHLLKRGGTKYLIIKAHDTFVEAAYRDKSGVLRRELVPLAEALQCVDINQVNLVAAREPVAESPQAFFEPQLTLVE